MSKSHFANDDSRQFHDRVTLIKTLANVSQVNEYGRHSITIRLIKNHIIIRIIHKSKN